MEEVEERGWDSWRGKRGEVGGDTVTGVLGGSGEVGDEGRSQGREFGEDVTGGSGLRLSSSKSADGCRKTSA